MVKFTYMTRLIRAAYGRHLPLIGLVILILIGGVLRLSHLGTAPLSISESENLSVIHSIATHGYPLLQSGKFFLTSTLFSYLGAASLSLFGFSFSSPWGLRLPAALLGLATIPLVYFFSKRLFKRIDIALLASALVAFSAWEIAWSHEAAPFTGLQFFILLSTYFLFSWFAVPRWQYLASAALAFIVGYLFLPIAIVFLPAFGLAILAFWHLHHDRRPSTSLISILAICGVIAAGVVVQFFGNLAAYLSAPLYFHFLFGTLLIPTIICALGLVFIAVRRNYVFEPIALLILITVPLIGIITFAPAPDPQLLFVIFPFAILFAVYLIALVIAFIPRLKDVWRFILCALTTLILFFPLLTLTIAKSSNELPILHPNFSSAFDAVRAVRKPQEVVITPYPTLSSAYLGDPGLWLPISVSGANTEFSKTVFNNKNTYTGAQIIPSIEVLIQIASSEHGYLIFDDLARKRLGANDWDDLMTDKALFHLVSTSGDDINKIWVYRF